MSNHRSRVLAARWIIPITSPPIYGGWVRLVDGRIAEIGRGKAPTGAEDWGEFAILPRLVNSHTHLEFSALERPVGEPGISLARWIAMVVASRAQTTVAARQQAVDRGLRESWETGTLLAGEITTTPFSYPCGTEIPQLVTFAEVLGLTKSRADQRLSLAKQHLIQSSDAACSPHAPYSISQDAIEATIRMAQGLGRMVAMHVAESPEERELLANGTGPLAETLRSLGVWQAGAFPWGKDPFAKLIDQLARAKSVLLVHGNDLNEEELQHLTRHQNVTVVYCPRTHHFFRFAKHPVAEMLAAGIRVAIGTDSRASNPDLNVWSDVQFLLLHRTDISPAEVLRMATKNGAEALGRARMGSIELDDHGELGCVHTQAVNLDQLYRDLAANDYCLLGQATI